MGNIFICYRREDSQSTTDRIFDHLTQHFSRRSLFKDVDNVPPGVDFRTYIDDAVRNTAVMLAIIGPSWLSTKNAVGQRRLDDPADFVFVELSSALRLQRTVIPVLVGGARMPTAEELPPALKPLAYINAVPMRSDPDFAGDFNRLRRALVPIAGGRQYSRWIAGTAIAMVVVGVAIAAVLFASRTPMPDPSPLPRPGGPIIAAPIRPDIPKPAASAPAAPAAGKDCVDVPFTDTTKIPAVITTKRICG